MKLSVSPTDFVARHPLLTIAIAALILRLPFLDGSLDFFDSPQYQWRSALPSLLEALSSGHAPYHPGYVFFTWLFHQLSGGGPNVNPTLMALVSVLASSMSLVLVYLIAQHFDSRLWTIDSRHDAAIRYTTVNSRQSMFPWLATALVAVAPYFWISSVTILVDPVMMAFYLLSVWLYLEWLMRSSFRHGSRQAFTPGVSVPKLTPGVFQLRPFTPYFLLLTSGLAFGAALFTHTLVAFWALAFPGLIIATKEPRDWLRTVWQSIPWLIGPVLVIAAYVGLLLYSGHNPDVPSALKYLLGGNAGDRSPFELVSGARNLRLIGGSVLALCAVLGSVRLLATPKPEGQRVGVGLAVWLWPGLILSGLYIYSNLTGRASLIGLVPAAMLAAFAAQEIQRLSEFSALRSRFLNLSISQFTWILLGSTLAASAPLIGAYATQPGMMEALNEVRKTLPRGGVYLSSNEAKTLHDYPKFDIVFEMSEDAIHKDIDAALANGRRAFVGSDALTYPYYAVDGVNWRIFSMAGVERYRTHGPLAAALSNRYELDLLEQIGRYPLAVAELRAPSNRSVEERYRTSLAALKPGQSAVLGRVIDEKSGEPVSHLQINAYGRPAVHPQRLERFDWPTRLGLWFEYHRQFLPGTRGPALSGVEWVEPENVRTRDPLFFGATDRSGIVAFPLPANSTVDEFALVPHTLATGATMSHPPLFVDPSVDVVRTDGNTPGVNLGTETPGVNVANVADLASHLASIPSGLAIVTRNEDGSYSYSLLTTHYSLKSSDLIKAAELSGHVSTILPDGSREAAPGQKGNVTFGPWKDLAPGNYVATWKLRRTTEGEDRVLRLDVGYNFGEGTIFEQSVGAGDLPLGELREISIPFTVEPHMKLLEFRTLALAGPGFIVDSISVRPQ